MLIKMWDKDGVLVNCEDSQLEEMKKNGFTYTENPKAETVIVKDTIFTKDEVIEESDKKIRKNKKDAPDIIL